MRFTGIALPMRCQPPHYGHLNCITIAARLAEEVRVFLCRDFGTEDDPFPLDVRRAWLNRMIEEAQLLNVLVVDRISTVLPDRFVEYHSAFTVESIMVFTTDETDKIYRSCGLSTFNHHKPENIVKFYGKTPKNFYSTGRIIRSRLKLGLSCQKLMPAWLEIQAKNLQDKT